MKSTVTTRGLRARVLAAALCAVSVATLAVPAFAQNVRITLESQPLGKALTALAEQADTTIFARAALVEGRTAPAISGDLSVEAALKALLAGSGLTYRRNNDGSYVVTKAVRPAEEHGSVEVPAQETVVVTGSRLGRNITEVSTPVITVGQDFILASGAAVLEDVLNSQPQYIGGYTSRSNNPGTGAAELDLRGLGPSRNLVLVNGRRYVFFEQDMVTDINTIPAALVERVETVTGGSSAVYGSDAIAGVTNFILRTSFEGIEARAQFGGDTRVDGAAGSFDLTWGTNFDGGRGNVVLSGNYYRRTGIRQSQRAYSRIVLADGYDSDGNPVLSEKGAMNTPNGAFSSIPYGSALLAPGMDGLRNALDAAGLLDIDSTGFTFDGAGSSARPFIDPDDRYNSAPLNYLQIPATRYGLSGFAHYDVTAKATLYAEFAYYHNEVDMQLAETNTSLTMAYDIDNPYVSTELQEVFHQLDLLETGSSYNDGLVNLRTRRRFAEIGARRALSRRDSLHAGFGVKGDLGDLDDTYFRNIHYDLSYFYNQANAAVHLNNMVSYSALASGLLRGADGSDPLVNLFGAGGITDEAADLLRIDTSNPAKTKLKTVSAIATGDVVPLPAGPLRASLGFEWRSAYVKSTPDDALGSGDALGFDYYQPTKGEVNVYEVFGEVHVPVLSQTSPVGQIAVNGAFRYSDYDLSVANGVWTYMSGLEWQPVPGLNLRGQWQHAVRAPNVGELFGGQSADRPRATDPCAQPSAATDATLRALCIATGVPAAYVGDTMVQVSERVDVLYGGNPDLDVESSNTYTLGFLYTPHFLPELTVTVDYFNITVKDAISTFAGGVESIMNLCYNVIQDPSSEVCRAIRRNPADGTISAPYSILATYANIGEIKTSGIDFGVAWSRQLPFGLFDKESEVRVDIRGTWLNKYSLTPIQDMPEEVNDCTGAFGLTCGDPRPDWKTVSRVIWTTGDLTFNVQHRHLSSVTDDNILIPHRQGASGPSAADLAVPVMGGRDYIDLSFNYELQQSNVTIYGGINNVFDVDPPIVGSSQQQANTYPSTYDALGSEYFLGAKIRL